MGITRLVHWLLVNHFVFLQQVDARVLLRGAATTCDEDLLSREGDRGRALVEFTDVGVGELLKSPLIFINVVAKADFRVDIVTEEQYLCLSLLLVQRGELKQGLFN